MTRRMTLVVGALAGAPALAQPIVDGVLDAGQYGNILWVQTQPTGFGNNAPAGPANPGAVTTGVEFRVPLSSIGSPGGAFRLAGWVNAPDRTFLSNQVIGGLPNLGNLGGPNSLDFNSIAGTQWITVSPASGGAPVVDGTLDAAIYGAAQFLQNNYTGFGNATHGTVAGGSGSEIDAVYAVVNGGSLYLFIAGNLEANNNGLDLFFDTEAGGQGSLSPTNPTSQPNNGLNNMAGLTFDGGFEADYYLTISGSDPGGGFRTEAYLSAFAALQSWFLGTGAYASAGGALTGGTPGAPAVDATIDNSNTIGVAGTPGNIPSQSIANGSEIDGIYGRIIGDRLYVLVTGNLETSWNKLDLFFDVAPGGQNPLREDNVDVDFGALGRMGPGLVGNPPVQAPGLAFDAGFAPDYYMNITNGNNPAEVYGNAAVLRTDGPVRNPGGYPLDYGAYDGGPRTNAAVYPTPFAGPRIDPQDGLTASIYCNYGPRTAGASCVLNPFAPVGTPNLLRDAIDNSNIAGVSGVDVNNPNASFSVAGAAAVTTGLELSIDLDELGWDGQSDVRIAGFINSGDHGYVSNQVLGGVPNSPGFPFARNLEEVRLVDFSLLAGDQFVVVPAGGCYPDCDGNSTLNVNDYICFQTKFALGDPYADCDGNGARNVNDYICFQTKFALGC